MMFYFSLLVSVVLIIIHVLLMKEKNAKKTLEVILLYLLVINFGLGNLLAGAFHVFNGPATARMIGWEPGSPFQYEVGMADMAFGLLGFLCLFIRGNFWLATILANSFFLIGCMIGHAINLASTGNVAAYNIGPNILFSDLIFPLIVIILYVFYKGLPDRYGSRYSFNQ